MNLPPRPPQPIASCAETVELALFDTLHALGVAEAASQRLLERTLDPDGSGAQFFATCDLRAELEQARGLLETAQARLASGFPHVEALVLEPPSLPVAVQIPV